MTKRAAIVVSLMAIAISGAFLIKSVPTVQASAYEWIQNFMTPGVVYSNTTSSAVLWVVNTTDNFYEYRSLYHSTSTDGPWTEWTDCRHEGYVNTSSTDVCYPFIPATSVTTTMYMRATVNFSGCGTYTPTPSDGCGSLKTQAQTWYP